MNVYINKQTLTLRMKNILALYRNSFKRLRALFLLSPTEILSFFAPILSRFSRIDRNSGLDRARRDNRWGGGGICSRLPRAPVSLVEYKNIFTFDVMHIFNGASVTRSAFGCLTLNATRWITHVRSIGFRCVLGAGDNAGNESQISLRLA